MSKILLINQSSGYLFNDIAKAFKDNKVETFLFTGNIGVNDKVLEGVNKIKSFKYNKKNIITRLFSWVLFSLHLFFHLIFNRDYDFILISSNPPIVFFIPLLVSKKNTKINYFDILLSSGLCTEKSTFYKIFKKLNFSTFSKFQNIFTIGNGLKRQIGKYTTKSDLIQVVNLWVPSDLELSSFVKTYSYFPKSVFGNKVLIVYSGNLGKTHNFEVLLETIYKLRDNNEINFIIAGDGEQKNKISSYIHKHSLLNVHLFPPLSYESYIELMAICDIAFISQESGFEDFSIPSKLFTNLVAGNAIIAQTKEHSDLDLLLKKYENGIVIYNNTVNDFAEQLLNIINSKDILHSFQKNSKLASKDFTNINTKLFIAKILQNEN
jgi:glycosyltransferase involved in cell wall biosynthesis